VPCAVHALPLIRTGHRSRAFRGARRGPERDRSIQYRFTTATADVAAGPKEAVAEAASHSPSDEFVSVRDHPEVGLGERAVCRLRRVVAVDAGAEETEFPGNETGGALS
jgi:hypothetical protein